MIRLGLDHVSAVLRAVGSPQTNLAGRVLHVAGTNGKGSVCAMLYAALKHVRLTVGMFNSPYLIAPLDSVKLARGGLDVPTDWNTWSQLDDQLAKSCECHDLLTTLPHSRNRW